MRRTAMLSALAILLGPLACSESPTEPAALVEPHGPATAAIAFVSTRDGPEHIYVANADGSGVTRLAEGSSPAWSWDGRKIAFVRNASRKGPAGIYVMNFDGSELRHVGEGQGPAWLPDGRIVFVRVHWCRSGALNIMNADGSDVMQLYSRSATFRSGDPCPITPVPVAGAAASSPDGRSIAFRDSGKVWIVDTDGSNLRELEELPDLAGSPAWSPDGSRIALITAGHWQSCDRWLGWCRPDLWMAKSSVMYSYDLATAGRQVIEAIYPASLVLAANPDWSPDGSELVFDLLDPTLSSHCWGNCPDAGQLVPRRIFTLSLETGEVRRLIPEAANPAFADYEDYGPVWARVVR